MSRSRPDGSTRDLLPAAVVLVVLVLDVMLVAGTPYAGILTAAGMSVGAWVLVQQLRLGRQRERELRRSSDHDPVTQLQREHVLHDALDVAGRGDHLVVVQCNGLRALVRRLPSADADRLVQRLASLVEASAGAGSVVSRTADDEFAALVRSEADDVAERLASAMSEAVTVPAATLSAKIDVRIGILPLGRGDGEPLDRARHAASVSDPGRAVHFGPSLERAYELERDLLRDLPRALSDGSLLCHFQPIIDIEQMAVVGAEGLARWSHPVHGWVRPDLFVRIAEESGAIQDLGMQMLRHALSAASRLRAMPGHEDDYVTVNVSPRQLEDPAFPALVATELSASGLGGGAIALELTEGVAASRDPNVRRAVDEVRRLGIRLALDDFGSGYASVNYLRRFRPDMVKVDRAYVSDLGRRGGDVAAALFQLLEGLGLPVIAEGVEHEETVALLRGLGCRFAQGYHFGRPAPVEALLAMAARAGDQPIVDPSTIRRATAADSDGPRPQQLTSTVHPLMRSTAVIGPDRTCADVEAMFNDHPGLNLVVVDRGDGTYSTVSSVSLHQLMSGPYGYGRALNSRRLIADAVTDLVRPLGSDTQIVDAVAVAMGRGEAERYDDLVVVGDRIGTVSVGRLMEALADDLRSQALRDPLTGLPNRRRFRQALDLGISRGPVTLLYVDLDGFKPINDLHGHAAGDTVLAAVASRIRTTARPKDVVARLGGDEFGMVLHRADVAGARAVAERLVAALRVPIEADGIAVSVGASIGIAAGEWQDADAAVAAADEAMYRAKADPDTAIVVAGEDDRLREPA